MLALSVLMALILVGSPSVQRPELSVVNGLDLVLVLRAVFMPSTARRTAVIGCLAVLPAVACAVRLSIPRPSSSSAQTSSFTWSKASIRCPFLEASALAHGDAHFARVITGLRGDGNAAAQRLGQYTLEEKIGEGGMGVVYRARHALLFARPRSSSFTRTPRPRSACFDLSAKVRLGERPTAPEHRRDLRLRSHPRRRLLLRDGVRRRPDARTISGTPGVAPSHSGRVIHILASRCAAALHECGCTRRDSISSGRQTGQRHSL